LDIVQSPGLVILRELPGRTVRVVHIERSESARHNGRRNGLARWEGAELVVETAAPVFPLWSEIAVEGRNSILTERFVRVADRLVYRIWYRTPEAETGPAEVRLVRCGR